MARLMQLLLTATAPRAQARFRDICTDPAASQRQLLRSILKDNAATDFGSQFGFRGVSSPEDYASAVPLGDYESHEPWIERMLEGTPRQLTRERTVFFATTSGTTGASKYIPVTAGSREAGSRVSRLTLASIYQACPGSLDGSILSMVSPEVESHSPAGIPCGAESGHAYRNLPPALQAAYACPYEVFEISDYDTKYYTLLRIAAARSDVSLMFSVNPSTIILLARRLEEASADIIRDIHDGGLRCFASLSPETRRAVRPHLGANRRLARRLSHLRDGAGGTLRARDVWPQLSAVVCWKGGSVGQYIPRFDEHFSPQMMVHEIGYLSSEHRGSVPISADSDLGALTVGTNYFEFWPADESSPTERDRLLLAHELEVGSRYFIYVTTLGGLYRYNMNDIIEVGGRYLQTPLIRFIQKGRGVVSFTGEKLYETQVIQAVDQATNDDLGGHEFIAAVGELKEQLPRYTFLIEYDQVPERAQVLAMAERLDVALGIANSEYATKRVSQRMSPAAVRVIKSGSFERFRVRKVSEGRKDGQFKVLRLTDDAAFAAEFEVEFEVRPDETGAGEMT